MTTLAPTPHLRVARAGEGHHAIGRRAAAAGREEEAVAAYAAALADDPADVVAAVNLGNALNRLDRLDEALRVYGTALPRHPRYAPLRLNRALALLAAGRWREGFEEYEWRLAPEIAQKPLHPGLTQPVWNGEPLAGRRLLLHAEQGIGDTINFIRYAPMVRAAGAGRIAVLAQAPVAHLLATVAGIDEIHAGGGTLPDHDLRLPLMSCPRLFGTTVDDVPGGAPYLRAGPAARTLAEGPALLVGLAWSGSEANPGNAARSIDPALLEPLLDAPGCRFVSLQYGAPGPGGRWRDRLVLPGPALDGFAATASLVAQLDLVITVDSAPAHLAGALGRPVWTLLAFAPDWRWLRGRADTPWYPTMRLFRQKRPADWVPVVTEVAEALAALARTTLAGRARNLHHLGRRLEHEGRLPEAAAVLARAVEAGSAEAPAALAGVGNSLFRRGETAGAEAAYRRALAARPDLAAVRANLAAARLARDDPEGAVPLFEGALAADAAGPAAWSGLAIALVQLGRSAEALAAFDRAIALAPEDADIRFNRSLVMLARGDLIAGWREYEWRFRRPGHPPRDGGIDLPLWDGTATAGRTILLRSEQGLGDTIQFVRFADLINRRGGRVVVSAPVRLAPLLAAARGVAQAVPHGEPLPPFDRHLPMASLPAVLGLTTADLAVEVPYIAVERAPPRAGQGHLRVGLAWAGSPDNPADRRRSMPLPHFAPILKVPGCRFVSLQHGPRAADIPAAGLRGRIADPGTALDGFLATARLVASLDLVITVDSAPAHLAGALGVPVWTLLAFAPDWRWLEGREDSPWYPTMRLFRQERRGDWAGVAERVAAALARLADGRRGSPP